MTCIHDTTFYFFVKKIFPLKRREVLQIKYIEKISVSMVKVNCYNEKTIHCLMLPKYV